MIFRTAWVYSKRGRNFLLTNLRLSKARQELKVLVDQLGAPTWSYEIAKGTEWVSLQLYQQGQEAISKVSAAYHMTSSRETSWSEFVKAILEEASRTESGTPWFNAATKGHSLTTRRAREITTVEYHAATRRAVYSVLSTLRMKGDFRFELPA